MRYVALVDGKAPSIGVSFPDCPGCVAMGKTMDEAVGNAIAALAEWIDDEERAGRQRPVARSHWELHDDPEVSQALGEGAIFIAIPYLPEAAKKWVRLNISIDPDLVAEIDAAAEARGLTRSSFLAHAAREKIRTGI
ncbi:hypothetical protein GCM10007874_48380 [Labrys miyagiensis]|uniref:HicB-like antitoxin of toxin-antitoxin system domain-containing protein n=1 Tax=Labrys miyagiensis TaxID=346912 RepID=A0ABQ6CN79_9HYPH|nr:type II toxin-antitoxin system HicB family antitoxin [Labrys miyagiensis]GLS21821.1 hypothetical protein GCM10007874_48380 [Labrys miyagiensis]